MRGLILLLILGVIAAGVALLWPRLEGEAPTLEGPDRVEMGAAGTQVDLAWGDAGTGLRNVAAFLEIGSGDEPDRVVELHSKAYPGTSLSGPLIRADREQISLDIGTPSQELPDGEATLVLTALDWSWSGWGAGNSSELRIPVRIDSKPPRVSVASGLTYVRRGGAAAVVYRVDADAARSGVRVGEAWFPGAALSSGGEADSSAGERIAVFAIPIDASEDPEVEVVAIDRVGNEAVARFDVRVQERQFPETSIALSDRFLERVGSRLGEASKMTERTPLATFQRINSELRERNEDVIANAIGAPTVRQWSGAFEQMKNSSVTSKFAELRHYTSDGERVSRARHYGFDLASTAHAPITASNGGTIVFAGDNGIYGNMVLIDHGLGITSLYGHLSNLTVQVGDRVVKGQELGRSGATGLAGGDHLHFAILVGRTYVDPVEWWDPKWIREHVMHRLPGQAGQEGELD